MADTYKYKHKAFQKYWNRSDAAGIGMMEMVDGYTVEGLMYCAWKAGRRYGKMETSEAAHNLVLQWEIEKKVSEIADALLYDVKGQMLARAQEFIPELMEEARDE